MNQKTKMAQGVLSSMMLSAVLAACATTGGTNQPVSVEDRAQARWNHLIAGEVAEAYGFLSPGYRSSVKLSDYQKEIGQKKVAWTGAQVLDSDCSETSCKVRIMLNYRVVGALPGVRVFNGKQLATESWINVDNSWWNVPKQ